MEPSRTDAAPRDLGFAPLAATFLRSLTIQGSWNYRTMIGGGFAFALLPVLRRLRGEDGAELESALSRHSKHFNAHPYLVGVALGAVARLEQDRAHPEVVERFKAAVRGPLGGLGDTLVWAGWLPANLLVALSAAWAGLPPVVCVLLFLVLYNSGHLGLRAWAFQVGFREGATVGSRLREAALGQRTEALFRSGALLVGVLSGLLIVSRAALGGAGTFWSLLAASAFALGLTGGFRVWRPTAFAIVGIVLTLLVSRAIL